MVHWNEEENGESEMEPFEEASETYVSDDEQSNDEEPQIKDVLENFSQSVAFAPCNDCGATCHENMETSKVSLYFPSQD